LPDNWQRAHPRIFLSGFLNQEPETVGAARRRRILNSSEIKKSSGHGGRRRGAGRKPTKHRLEICPNGSASEQFAARAETLIARLIDQLERLPESPLPLLEIQARVLKSLVATHRLLQAPAAPLGKKAQQQARLAALAADDLYAPPPPRLLVDNSA
jgi:hypothetical protein